jgi:hypothetical protein
MKTAHMLIKTVNQRQRLIKTVDKDTFKTTLKMLTKTKTTLKMKTHFKDKDKVNKTFKVTKTEILKTL